MARKGQIPKLTDADLRKKLVDLLRKGVPRKFAAQAVGIADRTLCYWLEYGRKNKNDIYASFLAEVKKAECEAVSVNVQNILRAAKKNWTASAWWLERRHPEEFGTDRKEIKELKAQMAVLMAQVGRLRSESVPAGQANESGSGEAGAGGGKTQTEPETTPLRVYVDGGEHGPLPEGPAEPAAPGPGG